MTSATAEKFLSTDELSSMLGGKIKPRTLANWRSLGMGPKFVKMGGKVAYPRNEVDAWLERRTVENTSQYRK